MTDLKWLAVGVVGGAGLAAWRPRATESGLAALADLGVDRLVLEKAGERFTLPDALKKKDP